MHAAMVQQHTTQVAWAFARLGHTPDQRLLAGMANMLQARSAEMDPKAIANAMWALAKLGYTPGNACAQVQHIFAMSCLHIDSQHCASITVCAASWRVHVITRTSRCTGHRGTADGCLVVFCSTGPCQRAVGTGSVGARALSSVLERNRLRGAAGSVLCANAIPKIYTYTSL